MARLSVGTRCCAATSPAPKLCQKRDLMLLFWPFCPLWRYVKCVTYALSMPVGTPIPSLATTPGGTGA